MTTEQITILIIALVIGLPFEIFKLIMIYKILFDDNE